MNRQEFFEVLIKELKNIEPNELQDVLQYYNEYFDDAGIENEQAVLEELGSPQKIAAAIRETSTSRYFETGKKTAKKSIKATWITIAAIFSAPIAIPIAAALFIVAISLLIVYGALVFCFYFISCIFALAGVILAITSFIVIPVSIPTFLVMLGTGLILAGLGVLFFIPSAAFTKASFKGIIFLINNKFLKRNKQ